MPSFADSEAIARWDAAQVKIEHDRRFRDSGAPSGFRGASVGQCAQAVRDYAALLAASTPERSRPSCRGLLLMGETGRGKTHAACAVLNSCLDRHSGLFLESQELDSVGFDESRLSRAKGTPLLVIDDLGNEWTRGHKHAVLFEIVKARCDNMRPTVMATQYSLAGLYERLDSEATELKKAFISRLKGCFDAVMLGGGDRR